MPDGGEERKAAIIAASRSKYATPRAEVEAMLMVNVRGETKRPEPPDSYLPPKNEPKPIPKPPPATPQPIRLPIAETPLVTVSEKESVKSTEPKELGRGGAQHKAIQKRVKEAAEKLGFRSVIEKPVHDGQGSVDLWLERGSQCIACEISSHHHRS